LSGKFKELVSFDSAEQLMGQKQIEIFIIWNS